MFSRCLRYFRSLIPVGFKEEVVKLAAIAVPASVALFMDYSIPLISTLFCGHLGRTELAGVALANAVINVTGVSVGVGLSAACDTLISQTFGSGNVKRVGVILQRAILILLLACVLSWTILMNTEPILLAISEDPHVVKVSQKYVKIFMIALPASFAYQLESRYLQNQEIIWPQVICGVVAVCISALTNYIFLFVLGLGVVGSAGANVISQYSMVITLFFYIHWKGLHKNTWAGWSKECLQEWGCYIRLAIPSMIVISMEWWTFEIGGFLAGLLNEVELGTQAIVFELANVSLMIPYGFSIAGSVRVGNALGAGETESAKRSATISIACAFLVSVCIAIIFGTTKDVIAYVFSNDEQIRNRVAQVMIIYAPFHIIDASGAAGTSIMTSLGKQKIGAICSTLSYYGIGFPIGLSLMFAAKLGVMGFWVGLLICVFMQLVFVITYLVKMDWRKATEEALERAGVQVNFTETEESPEEQQVVSGTAEGHSDTHVLHEAEDVVGETTVGRPLSTRELVLRRGLAVGVTLTIFTAGVITHVLLSRNE
ncbi:multidrug and toxin extrusion protein 1 [Alosa pseudoharengus]|uniref:multidrug and toxin extrusion protein 1 n=1 Tax=Alosa pseudoharengus TaxID=34774 RepID=UPI003F8A59FB